MNGEDDMGVCYDTVYSVQAAEKESIFVSDNRQTDYLSVSYRAAQEDIDARLFIGNDDSTFPRIVYIGTPEEVLKPVAVRDKDGEEYVSRTIKQQ